MSLLRLGPPPIHANEGVYWIAIAEPTFRSAGDLVIGPESTNLAELEATVNGIRRDLDQIVLDARERARSLAGRPS